MSDYVRECPFFASQQPGRGLECIEAINKFLAILSAYFYMSKMVEGRIELTYLVFHFPQVIDVDDKTLAHLNEARIDGNKCLIVHHTLEFDRLFPIGYYSLP